MAENQVGSSTVPYGCPCGHLTDPSHACTFTPYQVQPYHAKISGPILDRILFIRAK
ncbi:ATP-binding protein [Candidatus Omnitrophota bacterium]